MNNLVLRIASAAVLLPGVIAAFIAGGWWLRGLVLAAAYIGLFEYGRIVAKESVRDRATLMIAGGVATTVSLLVESTTISILVLQLACMAIASVFVLRPGDLTTAWKRLGILAFGVIYIGLGVACVARLRDLGDAHVGAGQGGYILVAFTATWANDTCAYFAGRAFGKHKMSASISPKKTWEGFAGGLVGTLVFLLVGRVLFPVVFFDISVLDMILVAVPASFLGPMGDLAESMLKRGYDVKDSGNIIPGHG
ncbi:MAG TPA: phosphatidate cytidylyltransferase, partial [Myxococcota bacterium]